MATEFRPECIADEILQATTLEKLMEIKQFMDLRDSLLKRAADIAQDVREAVNNG